MPRQRRPQELDPAELARLDVCLMRLRRMWSGPRVRSSVRVGVGQQVELSTVLVVDAVCRDAPPGGVSVVQVAESLDVAPSTASRLVDRAVAAGMVQRRPKGTDARRAVLTPTAAGRALQRKALRFRTGYLADVLRDWSAADVAGLADLLDRFAQAVETKGA
ncbi:MAG: MarR family winged helix-turn-helix transcriptional regulator [Dermatophilaceae bacterium]